MARRDPRPPGRGGDRRRDPPPQRQYDPYDDRWHDVVMDGDDRGVWLGANPLVVCDVNEHAFATDYARREDHVAKFIAHIDWNEVAKRYKAVDRM